MVVYDPDQVQRWETARRWAVFRIMVVVLTPLLLLPIPLVIQGQKADCAYVLLVMAIFWLTEAIPIGITALIPVFMFPLFGLAKAKMVCQMYSMELTMLLIGSFIVALAVEKVNLHRRIALRIIMLIGTTLNRIIWGFMLTTAFLSMWICNGGSTAIMLPIVDAVLSEVERQEREHKQKDKYRNGHVNGVMGGNHHVDLTEIEDDSSMKEPEVIAIDNIGYKQTLVENNTESKKELLTYKQRRMRKMMSLIIGYSATCGGSTTLIGSPVCLLTKDYLDRIFEKQGLDSGVTFAIWIAFAVPLTIISLIVIWIWLQVCFMGVKDTFRWESKNESQTAAIKKIIRKKYEELGPMSFAEYVVIVHFIILIVLWVFRAPGFIDGWSTLFEDGYTGNSTIAILIAVSLFCFPRDINWFFRNKTDYSAKSRGIMDIHTAMSRIPWAVILLLGGGIALSQTIKSTGLSTWLGDHLTGISVLPLWLIIFIICLCLSLLTELTSNLTVASISMPILENLALHMEISPLYLCIPACLACTYAFMLPVATPPNAVVFSFGYVKTADMAKAGALLNTVCVLLVTVAAITWIPAIVGYGSYLPTGWTL